MNRRYILLFFLFITQLNNLTAQKIHIGFDTGYGTYEMTKIKDVIENTMRTHVLQPHCVSNFPGYLLFRPNLKVEYKYLNVGVAYTLISTGSRYSIHDYSGDYKFDTQIVGNVAAAFLETPIYSFNRFKFLIAAESGVIFNKMKLDETVQLTDMDSFHDNYQFESINIFIKPYLKAEYKVWKNVNTNISIGYHKDVNANRMYVGGDKRSVSDFSANWDGIRTSIGLSYMFD